MSVRILVGARPAEIVAMNGDRVVLRCAAPSPPGSSLTCALDGSPPPIRVKVGSSKREGGRSDATYRVEGRLVDLTREQRAALAAALQSGSSTSDAVPPSQRPPTR